MFGGLSYRLIGPFRAGRAVACTGVPGDPDKFYFGSVGGGVWESDNDGRTWTPIFDQEQVASIGAIAVAPSDPNVIYVGSGEADMRSDIQQGNGVYKSTDAGKTWTRIGLEDSRAIGKILVDPHDPNTVYVAALGHPYGPSAERGVYKSTDGGATWNRVLYVNENTGATDLTMDPSDPSTILASMWQTRRPPWSVYPPSSGPGSGVYRTTDAGGHWDKIDGRGLPPSFGKVGLSFSPADPNRVYACVDTNGAKGGGVYRSDDKGQNWTFMDGEARIWGRGWYFCGTTADPKDPSTVYVMNTSTYRSTDGGKSFTAIKGAPGGDDYHTLWIEPDNPNRMILASDQGTVVSVDGAKTWSSWWNQPTGQFYHVVADDQFPYWVFGSQQDSGAMALPSRTMHNIISMHDWRPMSAGGESGTIAPDRLHPGTVIDNGGSIERLSDGWHKSVSPTAGKSGGPWRATWTLPIVASPTDPRVFYTSHQCIFRSGDSGNSWQQISPDLTRQTNFVPPNLDPPSATDIEGGPLHGVVYWIAPSPVAQHEIWAGTDDGYIWLTRDEGKTWSNVTPPQVMPWSKVGIIDASHFDAETAYAAVDRHRLDDELPYIYRTHDGGKHWDLITNGLPTDEYVNVVREDPFRKGLLYAGTERTVYVSFDDGDHWQPLQLNLPPASIRDIVFAGQDIVVGTHGRAVWIMDDASRLRQISAATATSPATLFAPKNAVLFIRGPGFDDGTPLPLDEPQCVNPPDGAIFDYYLPSNVDLVTIAVSDSKGKLLRTFSSAEHPRPVDPSRLDIPMYWIHPPETVSNEAGGHRYTWDLRDSTGSTLAPGAYTVTITAGAFKMTQPLKVVPDPRLKPGEDMPSDRRRRPGSDDHDDNG